ncbi:MULTISPECIES: bifunctional diguanylate cyclase/phosphodiesterase [unclassified Pseudomonas]|uniref:putative bifunctional diguanylate cyclase/phosphodiesterase n=1 Tax=unclassified Pseudomonas TaxID=196821 RepID=UPI00129EC57E|nr:MULTISPECIES: EAL domain-containing protein [unclassified Pseudomonas]MDH4655518.1 EAL domain-containing protein [Pseudomonas sp. BN606]MRK19979.1 EAL domain-containing protein [Pseudomonas sp. JG-B]
MDWLGLRFGTDLPADGQILLACTHNSWLVLLAFLVASGAGYCAFDMAERVAHAQQPETRRRWCWLGAWCLGGGIWAMHFIAMLAFEAPITIDYDIPTTTLSLVMVVSASLVGMYTLGRTNVEPRHYLAAALAIGLGITLMHYSGMAAIRSVATQYYHPVMVVVSVGVAVAASLAAMLLSAFFRERSEGHQLLKIPASLAMGGAICSMHFTGMLALQLAVPAGTELHLKQADNAVQLGLSLAVIAGMVLLFALCVAWADKKLQRKERDLQHVNNLLRELEQVKVKLQNVAHYDALTNLPNRRAFNDFFVEKLQQHAQYKQPLAVMFLDVDHFKRVNDSLGHDAGDELLKVVAERVRSVLRREDVIARLGGDEFCVLASLGSLMEAKALSQRIMHRMKEPITLAGRNVTMTTSIGISLFPDDGETCEELLKHADLALYQAKSSGRNNLHFFSHHLKHKATFELQLEEELHLALARDQGLFLNYQPILDLNSGQVTKLEALVRWQHPQLGLLSPDRFIGVAEANGFIAELDGWVLRRACRDLASLAAKGFHDLRVAVNCSALNLSRNELADEVQRVLEESGLRPQRLELEVTENALMCNVNQALYLLERIRSLGVSISIDDFGTGYSSLAYLKRLPLDTLKIDRSFVMDIPGSHADMEIVQAIIGMAHTLHLHVVAEGVETREQLEFLHGQGCDYIQGYLLSRPQSLEAIEAFLRSSYGLSGSNVLPLRPKDSSPA